MRVYLLVKESYVYWENDYSVIIKTFTDKKSAINYLAIEKEIMLEEAMGKLEVETVEELETLYREEEIIYNYINNEDNYLIGIEEWGYDSLNIIEQDVMKFDI